jgi:hypothetical protein
MAGDQRRADRIDVARRCIAGALRRGDENTARGVHGQLTSSERQELLRGVAAELQRRAGPSPN